MGGGGRMGVSGGGRMGVSGGGRMGGVGTGSKQHGKGTEVRCVFLRKVAVRVCMCESVGGVRVCM